MNVLREDKLYHPQKVEFELNHDSALAPKKNTRAILLFDGICNSCNSAVNFILKKDKKELFSFAPLQGTYARELLLNYNLSVISDSLSTVVLIVDQQVYLGSKAIFRVAMLLGWPWKVIGLLSFLPLTLTDFIYSWIAAHRYQWFGKTSQCRVPTAAEKARFHT